MQQRSIGGGSSQSPRSPQSSQLYLSVSVTEPAKMGTGVQAYISYKVITKVTLSKLSRLGLKYIVIEKYGNFVCVWLGKLCTA